MPVISKLVKQWRCWINRSRSFEDKELDELESHLLEDIDHLVEQEGISEEEAFNKAVIDMGIRENLDQEFNKVRGFPVKKVKHWFAIHAWIIGAVIVGLVISGIDFSPKEKPLPFLEKESIGCIFWPNDFYAFPKSIPNENKTYFYDSYHSNLFFFKNYSDSAESTDISLNGSYFDSFPEFVNPFTFDIDNQGKFYFLCSKADTPKQNVVFIFSDSRIESNIMLPHFGKTPGEYDNINVINHTLFLTRNYYSYTSNSTTEPNVTFKTDSEEKQLNTTTTIELIRNEIVFIDLNDPYKKESVLPVDKEILAMDQSGNKLAILTCGGNITIYSFENNQLSITKKMKIDNFSELEEIPTLLSMMYCENNDQIVLKLYRSQHLCYFLQPIDEHRLKVISLQKTDNFKSKFFDSIVNIDKEVLGVLKINYNGRERIVFCKKGAAPNWANSDWDGAYMYLFK